MAIITIGITGITAIIAVGTPHVILVGTTSITAVNVHIPDMLATELRPGTIITPIPDHIKKGMVKRFMPEQTRNAADTEQVKSQRETCQEVQAIK